MLNAALNDCRSHLAKGGSQFLRHLFATAVVASLSGAICSLGQALAAEWPQRPVRFILPFGPGTAADTVARVIGDDLSARWGHAVVVENKPGADGLIAIRAVISANDDHMLLITSTGSFLAHPYMHAKLDYDIDRDLAPVARIADTLLVTAVPSTLEAANLAQFVQLARARPEIINLSASPGLTEFAVDAFVKQEGLKTARVPYKELAAASRDLSESRIHLLLTSYAVVRPFVEAGKVKIIAAGTRQRSTLTKDIPSIPESGYPILAAETSTVVLSGGQMSEALRRRIASDIIAALNESKIRDRVALTGQDVVPSGPDDLTILVKQQSAKADGIAQIIGLRKAGN
jgi:tripartite-type tricarboxylate transporter receptor subunit TctC